MKKTILLLVLLLIFSFTKTSNSNLEITSSQLEEMVAYLASDALAGRRTGTPGIDVAATYIEKKLKDLSVKPYFEGYRDYYKIREIDAFNVVGVIEGNDPKLKEEFIILGAHYDHLGNGKTVENDSIANGANDNASGTASVLALAEYFSKKKNNKRSIMIALYSGEEMGLKGSKHLAEKLKTEGINLYTMLSFEMLGVPFVGRDYEAFVTGYDLSNMGEALNSYVGSNLIGKSDVAVKYNLFKRSDNYPFYQAFKIPAHTFSSCDLTNYDYYHNVDDEAEKLDYEHMASLINKVIPAIEAMSNTSTKEIKLNE